jgi:Tol biopolymer transport system component
MFVRASAKRVTSMRFAATPIRVAALSIAPSLAAPSFAQDTITRVSVDSAGAQASGISSSSSISGDGRFVAFLSSASNLVAGDGNALKDAFVHDRITGMTTRESLKPSGGEFHSRCVSTSLSFDGRFLAFGLEDGPAFLRDLQAATTRRVSVDETGTPREGYLPLVSSDGAGVVFLSRAAIESYDTNGIYDVYFHDCATGRNKLMSVGATGQLGNSHSGYLGGIAISADARFVAFGSGSTNLVPGDTNGASDVFLRDRALGTLERVNLDPSGGQASGGANYPSVSADGRYVAFSSGDAQLVPGDTNGKTDVFVRDRWLGRNELVSVDSLGLQASDVSFLPALSPDGRFVGFTSFSPNLIGSASTWSPGPPSGFCVRDRVLGTSTPIVAADGSALNADAMSADGRSLSLSSLRPDLVPNDTNNFQDVFVLQRAPQPPIAFCTAGTSANGCSASLSATGTPSAGASSGFVLSATHADGQRSGLIFYGLDNLNFVPPAWGASSSFLCVKPPTQRTPLQASGGTSGACDGVIALDWRAFVALDPGALGNPLSAGQQVFAQTWLRDPASAKTTTLSNALAFTVVP